MLTWRLWTGETRWLVPPAVSETPDCMLRGPCRGSKLFLPHGRRCLEPVPFDEPGCVIALPKDQQGLTELLDGVEGAHPEQVLLQGPDEALGAAVPLGSPHEGRRALDAQEGKFLLESIGHVLAPMIVPHGKTARDLFGESAEAVPHALADRLERLKAGRPACGMDAHTLG